MRLGMSCAAFYGRFETEDAFCLFTGVCGAGGRSARGTTSSTGNSACRMRTSVQRSTNLKKWVKVEESCRRRPRKST